MATPGWVTPPRRRSLEDDIIPGNGRIIEPQAKRARVTEYYQYIVFEKTPADNCVYLLDMASPGADAVHALLQRRMVLDIKKNTIYASIMLDVLLTGKHGLYSDKWKLAAELKTLKDTGAWECLDPNSSKSQGRRGLVYYLYGFE